MAVVDEIEQASLLEFELEVQKRLDLGLASASESAPYLANDDLEDESQMEAA